MTTAAAMAEIERGREEERRNTLRKIEDAILSYGQSKMSYGMALADGAKSGHAVEASRQLDIAFDLIAAVLWGEK